MVLFLKKKKKMNKNYKIAVIIQRFGKEVLGGSETLAFKVAKILAKEHKVTVLTTTAKEHTTWKNYWEPGEYSEEGIKVKRFWVDFPRSSYWEILNQILLKFAGSIEKLRNLPLNFCREWVKYQGPYSSELFKYLKKTEYDKYIFFTYLYPTTFFGIETVLKKGVEKEKIYFVPTYHQEPPAYLPVFLEYQELKHLFLTKAEAKLAINIYQKEPKYQMLGFGMEDHYAKYAHFEKKDFVIYAGRIEQGKGVKELVEYFRKFYKRYPKVKLYLIGRGKLNRNLSEGVVYKGFVDEKEKLRLLREARVFIHPSPYESLGIVLLEAFMMGTPGLVNGKCEVLREHIEKSGAGKVYNSYEEFEKKLKELLKGKEYEALQRKARKYFIENYSMEQFKRRVKKIIKEE